MHERPGTFRCRGAAQFDSNLAGHSHGVSDRYLQREECIGGGDVAVAVDVAGVRRTRVRTDGVLKDVKCV
jgi:hypothetical protein